MRAQISSRKKQINSAIQGARDSWLSTCWGPARGESSTARGNYAEPTPQSHGRYHHDGTKNTHHRHIPPLPFSRSAIHLNFFDPSEHFKHHRNSNGERSNGFSISLNLTRFGILYFVLLRSLRYSELFVRFIHYRHRSYIHERM